MCARGNRGAVDDIQEKVRVSFRLLHRSLSPGAPSFCFATRCHSNRWQFHIRATCPADRQRATTRGSRLHTHRHTQTHTDTHRHTQTRCPADQPCAVEEPRGSSLHTTSCHHHVPPSPSSCVSTRKRQSHPSCGVYGLTGTRLRGGT